MPYGDIFKELGGGLGDLSSYLDKRAAMKRQNMLDEEARKRQEEIDRRKALEDAAILAARQQEYSKQQGEIDRNTAAQKQLEKMYGDVNLSKSLSNIRLGGEDISKSKNVEPELESVMIPGYAPYERQIIEDKPLANLGKPVENLEERLIGEMPEEDRISKLPEDQYSGNIDVNQINTMSDKERIDKYLGLYPETETAKAAYERIKPSTQSRITDYDKQMAEMARISQMPEGQEKTDAYNRLKLVMLKGTYYDKSPEGIQSEIDKILSTAGPEASAAWRKAYAQQSGKESTYGGQIDLETKISKRDKEAREEAEAARQQEISKIAYKKDTERLKTTAQELLRGILSGKTQTGYFPATWASIPMFSGSKEKDVAETFNFIKNNLTQEKLRSAKQNGFTGAMSDADIAMIAKSASMLDYSGSMERNARELKYILDKLQYTTKQGKTAADYLNEVRGIK